MTREDINELYPDESLILLEPDYFDSCIIGVVEGMGLSSPKICYCIEAIIETLAENEHYTYEDAMEDYSTNISGFYAGEGTPCFINMGFEDFERIRKRKLIKKASEL